jgi:putative DNA primase/helicase
LADLKNFGGRRKGNIELYNFGRYLTVTGHHIDGTPRDVQARLPQIRQLYRQYLKPTQYEQPQPFAYSALASVEQADEQVLERMFSGKNGQLYRQIYHGDTSEVYSSSTVGDPDESRADVLLFNALAFYTYQDPEQMRRILLASPRAQQRLAKWHKRVRGERNYLDYQIEDSITYTRKR